jgi:phenylalanyl-tRNA synthetase beta chain
MKISLKWLRDYVDINTTVAELAEKLTTAGLEVGELKVIGGNWSNISVARLIAVNPHPNADRLRLATVDLGVSQPTVVCGAPNLNIGDKVIFAGLGARLLDSNSGETITLKPAKIRGVPSEGMICSEKELGISDRHDGIVVLPSDAPVGVSLAQYLGDTIMDIDVTPNRPDCLSVIGIAREVSAHTLSKFHIPETNYAESGKDVNSLASIRIDEAELCPRYCASLLTGIKVAPSPQWLQQRLLACGVRPITNVVDVTNYVMLEYGQPLHAFDFEKVRGQQIIVRRAIEGEALTTLDGIQRKLKSYMLVISDKEGAVAVAGVMGGGNSEVTDNTSTVLIESANFNRAIVHGASVDLKLSSEASSRFEKGLSPELAMVALRRATQLMMELTGGMVARGIIDVYPGKRNPEPIILPCGEVKRFLGIEMQANDIVELLNRLCFNCEVIDSNSKVKVDIPWWRTDITSKADLVEEIARVFGYDNLPATMMESALPAQDPLPILSLRQNIRNIMVSCGFQEILTYSLTSPEIMRKLTPQSSSISPEPLKVANPMSKDLECLRTTLRSNVLATLARNQRFQKRNFRFFELGKVFLPKEGSLPEEKEMLCAVLNGLQTEAFWQGGVEALDFFVAKGIVETLLSRLGLKTLFLPDKDESLSPGSNAYIIAGEERIGVIGEVHPRVVSAFDISDATFMLELDIDKLLSLVDSAYEYQSIARYPGVIRDMALVVDDKITYQQVYDIIRASPLVIQLNLFDLYRGEQISAGKKSLACRVMYQSNAHTLSDEEVDGVQQNIIGKLSSELGATLRA